MCAYLLAQVVDGGGTISSTGPHWLLYGLEEHAGDHMEWTERSRGTGTGPGGRADTRNTQGYHRKQGGFGTSFQHEGYRVWMKGVV